LVNEEEDLPPIEYQECFEQAQLKNALKKLKEIESG
jgi:hypothetical protein